MPRAIGVIAAGLRHEQVRGRPVVDAVILNYAQRSAPKATVTSAQGASVEIDLHGPVRLRTDDLLALDDGTLMEVVAAPESLIEARAADLSALARLAWHLGDRHIPVELLANRIRVRREVAIEALLVSLGAKLMLIDAPFEPEGGAYAAPAHDHSHHDHDHGHDHSRDHTHHHCGHAHSHAHGHKHGH